MRIVAGKWRGRRLARPADAGVRPTADRVREAWMSIVTPDLPGSRVLDLFAGSGALGIEAVSRGALSADLVEHSEKVLRTTRSNVLGLGASDEVRIVRSDALTFLRALQGLSYGVAFVDPPYRMGLAEQVVELWLARPFCTVLGVEHAHTEIMPASTDVRRYGDSSITFYRAPPE